MIALITGSSGFLGSECVRLLECDKIITLGRKNAMINIDLSAKIPLINAVDLVIHMAGKAHFIPRNEQEKKEFYNVNLIGTQNLLKGLENAPALPKSFVFISSVAVYGLETGKDITENTSLLALDPYGKSKIQAEKLVIEWCEKNNVVCTILRLPLLAGPNPPGNLQSMIKGIQSKYYFNIAGGKARKSMVLTKDVIKIIPVAANIGGIYNLTDQYHPSFLELSEIIVLQLEKSMPLNIPMWMATLMAKCGDLIGSKAPINSNKLKKITSDLTFDDSKAQKLLKWEPTPVLSGFKIK